MSWLLFYDWRLLFQLPVKWVSIFGFSIALFIAGTLWIFRGQPNQDIHAQLTEQVALQQQSHLLYLRKLRLLDEQKIDYRKKYLKQTRFAATEISKTAVFNYLSSGLADSSIEVSSWQWEQGEYSQLLVLELNGTYSEIANFLRTGLSFSDLVIAKELRLSRQSTVTTQINGRLILSFFIVESAESS